MVTIGPLAGSSVEVLLCSNFPVASYFKGYCDRCAAVELFKNNFDFVVEDPMASNENQVVLIGVAGDSGCGKSTFLRRLSDLFGEQFMTVICLDDYHSLDRKQRKAQKVTALNPKANNFDLMYEQIKALKEGNPIDKPIYNHETGELDPPEKVKPNKIVVIEGSASAV